MQGSTTRERRALVATALAGAWLCAVLPVFSQEAYYWTYAQHPDLSYFDHPPMMAWLIWLGTQVFGDGAIGVRLGTWLAALTTTLCGVALLRRFGVGERGRIAWILTGVAVPAFLMLRFLANPDPPLVAFWTLTLLLLWRAREGGIGWWLLAGLAAGGALLSKYTGIFLAAGGVLVLLLDPKMRAQLLRPGPWLGVLTAGVAFLPVLIWNVRNDFESFRHQTSDRFALAEFGPRWFFECIGGQFGLLNPVLALLIPIALLWLWRRTLARDPRALWMLAFGLPLPLYILSTSLWMQVKFNWFTPAYVALFLGGAMWWQEAGWIERHPRWCRATSIAVGVMFALLPLFAVIHLVPSRSGTSWAGWAEVAARSAHWARVVDAEDGVTGNVFFFGVDYRDSAQLGRNLEIGATTRGPDGEVLGPTITDNVQGAPALQFDHWTQPADLVGHDAILAHPRPDDRTDDIVRTRPFFESMERVERVVVERLGIRVFEADIWICRGYLGPSR